MNVITTSRHFIVSLLLGLLGLPFSTTLQAQTSEAVGFFRQNCVSCHTIGGGVLIGPDLKDITQQRDPQWVKNFITNPAQMIASDPAAQQLRQGFDITMPTLGLAADQIDQVVAVA